MRGFLAMLGVPAAGLGIIEGAADVVASFTKMLSGYIADKLGQRKMLVLVGYGLTPLGQALIALAAGWPLLLADRLVSWFGKGLRGPLRDAIDAEGTRRRIEGDGDVTARRQPGRCDRLDDQRQRLLVASQVGGEAAP